MDGVAAAIWKDFLRPRNASRKDTVGLRKLAEAPTGKYLIFLRENWSPSIYIGTLAADGTHLLAHRRLTLDESAKHPVFLDTG